MAEALSEDLLAKLRFRWRDFPPATPQAGTGGRLRRALEDFQVDELPLYQPEGSGSHAYARVRKRGLTTRDLVLALVRRGVAEKEVGVAGLKDKHAVSTQWLSVPQRHRAALEALAELEGAEVLELSRHRNKLGIGHLAGNRFTVRVREAAPEAASRAEAILADLRTRGVPNYFGPQRFGRFGTNAADGYRLLRGARVPGGQRLKLFFVSALQSLLFNHLLARRIGAGLFERVVVGDWAKKHDTGGVFEVQSEAEAARALRLEISATLPLYGKKVRLSQGVAGELERAALAYFELKWSDFARRRGDRRPSRFPLARVELQPQADGYTLSFDLPKGAFATSLLREVMKVEVDEPTEARGETPLEQG